MKLVVEFTDEKRQKTLGTVVGFTATDTSSYAIIVQGERLLERRISDLRVFSLDLSSETSKFGD